MVRESNSDYLKRKGKSIRAAAHKAREFKRETGKTPFPWLERAKRAKAFLKGRRKR